MKSHRYSPPPRNAAGLPIAAQNTASPFYGPIRNNDLAGLRRLVQKSGANTGDARHTTPLMYAAALGSLDAVKLLVEAGAGVNTANDFGATPLMWCAGDLAKVRYLLSKGAGVTARSKVGRTPLGIAAAYDGSVEIARLLIEQGADVKAVDESGASVLEIAASVNNVEVARLLVAKGAELGDAVSAGDRSAELVKLLLDHGAKVNVASGDTVEIVKNGKIRIGWMTPLLLAAPQANYQVVEMMGPAQRPPQRRLRHRRGALRASRDRHAGNGRCLPQGRRVSAAHRAAR